MKHQETNLSKATLYDTQRFEAQNSRITPDNCVGKTCCSPEPLIVRNFGDKALSGACYGDCENTRSTDKRPTVHEMREKINNLKKQIWYNWTYLTILSEIDQGEVGVISAGEYNRLTSTVKRDLIVDEDWAFLQAAAKKLEDEFGEELDAIPDDIDRAYLEGKLSALRYACGEEVWEHLYA